MPDIMETTVYRFDELSDDGELAIRLSSDRLAHYRWLPRQPWHYPRSISAGTAASRFATTSTARRDASTAPAR